VAPVVDWQPIDGQLWRVATPWMHTALWIGFACGCLLVLVSTLLIDHFDLFGLRQAYRAARGRSYEPPPFDTPSLCRMVRHPLYVGCLLAFWCAPSMNVGQLPFAMGTTAYILVAIRFEERDLGRAHPEYTAYREHVPMLIPGSGARKGRVQPAQTD
jgi:protein-S-isoprenylcysteine O-methyltransferase Ste14